MQKLADVKLTKFLKKRVQISRDGKPVVSGTLRAFWLYPPTTLANYSDDLLVLWLDDRFEGYRVYKTDDIEEKDES